MHPLGMFLPARKCTQGKLFFYYRPQFLLNYKFIQQSVVASSKAVVEDVAEPNMPNAAVKVAVLISKEIQCSADVTAVGLYRATFMHLFQKFWLLHRE